ncbi:MAG: 6-bladed beta-propeller [Opitutaceae bacterium]|nr:6-bladed beta-propeller [Opitutaceae bacterium]
MKSSLCILATLILLSTTFGSVRMGSGIMTFDTVTGWGLGSDGKSVLGPTHGSVVIDKAGNIYTSADKGVVVFNPSGKVLRSFIDEEHSNLHDMEIREEDGVEYIYGARNKGGVGIKFEAQSGDIVLTLGLTNESGLALTTLKPTAITVAPNGDIFLSDGYSSNIIFKYDKNGKYLTHFGKKGDGLKEFHTPHGMTLDTRYDPPRLLICDRNHLPIGRLLHYDLDGNFIEVVATNLNMPTSVAIRGDYVSVPSLEGRVYILDKNNSVVSVLGYKANPGESLYKVQQEDWVEGIFSGTHGSYWDKDSNLYVQDWNIDGRIMKLVRVK